jgi:adenine nucleotide transporter 17
MAAASASPPIAHAIGGSLGSALALLLFYPLERARIELQSQASSQNHNNNAVLHQTEHLESVEVEVELAESPSAIFNQASSAVLVGPNEGPPRLASPTSESSSSWLPLESSTPCSGREPLQQQQQPEELSPSWSMESNASSESTASPAITTTNTTTTTTTSSTKLGLLKCLLRLQQDGALYQGVTPVVTTIFISQFVFFYMHAYTKGLLRDTWIFKGQRSSAILSLVSACIAGVANVLLTNPLWVVNIAIVTDEATTGSLVKEFLTLVRTRGWKHMWNGTSASLLLVSNPVIQFFCYEQLKQARLLASLVALPAATTTNAVVRTVLPPLEAFAVGALAKGVATITTYPLQLAQTVLRLRYSGYKGTLDCLCQLYKRGGVEEWYTGMRAKLLQTVLTAAFTFLTYEQILGAVQMAIVRHGGKSIA